MRAIPSLIVGVLAAATVIAQGPHQPLVVLDGEFDEWDRMRDTLTDPRDATESYVDFVAIRATADERFIYLSFDLHRPIPLQTMAEGTILVLVDEDGRADTGQATRGQAGIDRTVEFGQGVVVRRYEAGGAAPIVVPLEETGVLFAPRFASSRFELRLDRGSAERATLKVIFELAGAIGDEVAPMALVLPRHEPSPTPSAADQSPTVDPLGRRPGASFRALVWNVLGLQPGLRGKSGRIVRAIDPDVVLLTELSRYTTPRSIEDWLNGFNGQSQAPWRVVVGTSGSQLSAVALRAPLERAFGQVHYETGALASLLTVLSPEGRWSLGLTLNETGVGATGAKGLAAERELFMVALDLTSGGGPEAFGDASRIAEASAIARVIRRAQRPGLSGLLVGGDFNLVGTRDPLDALAGDLDLDKSALSAVPALKLDGRSNATWRAFGGGRFTPGRLDWLLYSDSSLEVLGSFVFDAGDLTPLWLAHHRLVATDSHASDHFPVVADFRWRRIR